MNEAQLIQHMIEFVEATEDKLHADKTASEANIRKEAVKAVLKELERVTADEDKQD